MNPILRNLIVETLVVILLGIALAARIAPAEITFPTEWHSNMLQTINTYIRDRQYGIHR